MSEVLSSNHIRVVEDAPEVMDRTRWWLGLPANSLALISEVSETSVQRIADMFEGELPPVEETLVDVREALRDPTMEKSAEIVRFLISGYPLSTITLTLKINLRTLAQQNNKFTSFFRETHEENQNNVTASPAPSRLLAEEASMGVACVDLNKHISLQKKRRIGAGLLRSESIDTTYVKVVQDKGDESVVEVGHAITIDTSTPSTQIEVAALEIPGMINQTTSENSHWSEDVPSETVASPTTDTLVTKALGEVSLELASGGTMESLRKPKGYWMKASTISEVFSGVLDTDIIAKFQALDPGVRRQVGQALVSVSQKNKNQKYRPHTNQCYWLYLAAKLLATS